MRTIADSPEYKKAMELIEKFLPNVYCYLGSGMLTNTYDENVARSNAKACAIICVEEIISYQKVVLSEFPSDGYDPQYWVTVLSILKTL